MLQSRYIILYMHDKEIKNEYARKDWLSYAFNLIKEEWAKYSSANRATIKTTILYS